MKKCFLIFALSFVMQAIAQNTGKMKTSAIDGFTLNGKIEGQRTGMVYLYYPGMDDKRMKDSVLIVNGKFSFRGNINGPSMAYLQLKEDKRNEKNSLQFFLEPSKINIALKLNKFADAKISGSASQYEYALLLKSKNEISAKYQVQLDSLRTEKDHEKNAEIREKLAPYFSEMDQADFLFFDRHPDSYVTLNLMRYHTGDLTLDSLQMFYDRLGEKLQQTKDGEDLAGEIEKLRGGSPGSMAKEFSATDINGKELNLADFKGKYVLLDFWASWCVPCRKGNPHLKELYAKYKGQGIEFIGVSDDDRNHDAWKKAVEKDGLPWRHVLRGLDMEKRMKGEPNETDISEKFGIHTLPTKVLIDREGKIIGRYSEEEYPLDAKLKEVFGN